MSSPYQEFLAKARARMGAQGGIVKKFSYTRHAEYKMREYRLSRQKVEGVIRRPRRTETGIAPRTSAVMQPVSPKRDAKGTETWNQEVWVLYQIKNQESKIKNTEQGEKWKEIESRAALSGGGQMLIISAWRYPGMSPEKNPIPEDILREIEEGDIMGTDNE
jgi:hypothetical protein